jgi:hypothetical protein
MVSLGIFSVVPPTEPCALRSTQPLKVSTRDFSWSKGGRCFWLTTYHSCSAETSRKSGTPWATSACRGTPLLYLPFHTGRYFRLNLSLINGTGFFVFLCKIKLHTGEYSVRLLSEETSELEFRWLNYSLHK